MMLNKPRLRPVTVLSLGLFLLLASLLSQPVSALTRVDLYRANIAVDDRSEAAREAALQTALQVVLGRMTGKATAELDSRLNALQAKPQRYLTQYSYDQAGEALRLSISFDEAALSQAVQQTGVAVWGANRPQLLSWMVVDDGLGQRIMTAGDTMANVAMSAAQQRGLPLTLPLLDAEDIASVSAARLWQGGEREAWQAAMRYQANAVLIGRIQANAPLETGAAVTSRWALIEDGRVEARWQHDVGSYATAVDSALLQVAAFYANRLAINTDNFSSGGSVQMAVAGVHGLAAYADTLSHLQSLAQVADIAILAVNGSDLRLQLRLNGSIRQLQQAIQLGNRLKVSTAPLPSYEVGPPGFGRPSALDENGTDGYAVNAAAGFDGNAVNNNRMDGRVANRQGFVTELSTQDVLYYRYQP